MSGEMTPPLNLSSGQKPRRNGRTRITGKADRQRELMEQARRAGWQGKSYRKAKQFDQRLTRDAKALARQQAGAQ